MSLVNTTQGAPPGPVSLEQILDLEQIEVWTFRGFTFHPGSTRVFGGQVAGQALVAAGRTVPEDHGPESEQVVDVAVAVDVVEMTAFAAGEELRELIQLHAEKTNSTRARWMLADWSNLSSRFVRLTPLPQA